MNEVRLDVKEGITHVEYEEEVFQIGEAKVIFAKWDPDWNSKTRFDTVPGDKKPFRKELEFWLNFITNESQEHISPYHLYNTVYLNLDMDNPEGINNLFNNTGLKYKWLNKILFMWLDKKGLEMLK